MPTRKSFTSFMKNARTFSSWQLSFNLSTLPKLNKLIISLNHFHSYFSSSTYLLIMWCNVCELSPEASIHSENIPRFWRLWYLRCSPNEIFQASATFQWCFEFHYVNIFIMILNLCEQRLNAGHKIINLTPTQFI